MSRPLRIIVAISLPLVLLLLVLLFPELFLQEIILPTATALWLVLRIFVLSIHQEVYWWAVIVLAVAGVALIMSRGNAVRAGAQPVSSAATWDPSARWKGSIQLNMDMEPSRDLLRRDLGWLLSSLYTSPHPGGARYEVHEALEERRIQIPQGVYDFLFASAPPGAHALPRSANPRARARAAVVRLRGAVRMPLFKRRRENAYLRSVDEVLTFMETQLEMTDELDPDA